jgi:cytoskeletal protein CcmA (bactofilin family)
MTLKIATNQMPEAGAEAVAGTEAALESVVSRNFNIVGNLTCHDVLRIEGSVEGNIECEMLTIGEAGEVKGDIRADIIDMKGKLSGSIEARVLNLARSAEVEGDLVIHESLGIEPGAVFDGTCKHMRSAPDTKAAETAMEAALAKPAAAAPVAAPRAAQAPAPAPAQPARAAAAPALPAPKPAQPAQPTPAATAAATRAPAAPAATAPVTPTAAE